METKNELPDSQTPEGEEDLDSLLTPQNEQNVQMEELASKNKKLFERAKKAEEDRKVLREKLEAQTPKETPPPASKDDVETVLELRSKGYSDAEVLTLRKYAKSMNKPIEEVADDPFIKSGIEAERLKAKVAQATPAPSSRSVAIEGKTWADMSEEERKKNFSQMTDRFKK